MNEEVGCDGNTIRKHTEAADEQKQGEDAACIAHFEGLIPDSCQCNHRHIDRVKKRPFLCWILFFNNQVADRPGQEQTDKEDQGDENLALITHL